MRNTLRIIVRRTLALLVTIFVLGVVGEFFIRVAEDKGWYRNAGQKWDTAMTVTADGFAIVASIALSTPFLMLTAACAGAFFALRTDRSLSVADINSQNEAENSGYEGSYASELGPSITPQFLAENFYGKTDAQGDALIGIYKGKRIRFTAILKNVSTGRSSSHATLAVPRELTVADKHLVEFPISIYAEFYNDREEVAGRKVGDIFRMSGKIKKASEHAVYLEDCRLLGAYTQTEFKLLYP